MIDLMLHLFTLICNCFFHNDMDEMFNALYGSKVDIRSSYEMQCQGSFCLMCS